MEIKTFATVFLILIKKKKKKAAKKLNVQYEETKKIAANS